MTKNFKKNAGGSKPGTPQAKKAGTPKQTPKSDSKKNNVKFEVESDNELTAADIEAVMTMGSGKKQDKKQTPVQNNKPNKKNTPTSNQKQSTPASNKNNKKRQREESDEEKDEEVKSPEKKKLIFSPESKTPVSKTGAAQNKTPNSQAKKGKAATPAPVEKKETPLKSILKKRAREEDEEEEVVEVAKKVKVEPTPKKAAEPTPKKGKEPTPKKGAAKKVEEVKKVEEAPKTENEIDLFKKGMEERDNKMLIIMKINHKVKEDDVKKLSDDIVDVTMKVYYKARKEGGKKVKESYTNAYLSFADEKTATTHFELLKEKELLGEKCNVDFVGSKSQVNKQKQNDDVQLDLKRLYFSGFNKDTVTLEKVQAAFPNSVQISLPSTKSSKKSKGYGFVSFADEESCKAVLNEKKTIDNRTLNFTYAKVFNARKPQVDIVKTDAKLQAEAKKEKEVAKKNKKAAAKSEEVEEKVTAVVAPKNKKELAKLKKQEEEKKKQLEEEEEDDDDDDDDDDEDDDEDDEDDDDEDDDDDDDEDDDEDDDDDDDDEDDD